MKRVPLTHKDYPENFNKLAKYISKNWIDDKLSLEQSRQQLATWLGYNSIFELEKSFVKSIPGLVDVDALMYSIKEKIETSFSDAYINKGNRLATLSYAPKKLLIFDLSRASIK